MKKVLLATAAVLVMTGCSQNEEFENPGQDAKINFGSIVRNSTRANILTTSTFEEFKVSGYKTANEMAPTTQLATEFIDNLIVEKGIENEWTYTGNTFYWPYSGKVQFFATYPGQTLDITTTPGYPVFKYTVKEVALQEDLVAANLINKDKAAGTLTFPFQHLLTQVNFSIKGDTPGFTYTVSKIELKGLKDGGTFKYDGTNTVGAWSDLTVTAQSLAYTSTTNNVVSPTTAQPEAKADLEESNKALFMLMPQDASAITLDITYASANGNQTGFSGTKTVTLTGTWAKGHSVRYVLKLTSDTTPISFGSPTLDDDWITDTDIPGNPKK